MDVLSGAGAVPRARTVGPKPRPVARSRVARRATRVPVVAGTGSNYPGTAGFIGAATVALPSAMGGRYTGAVQGHVTVCADRCVRLPAVDWCQCHWGEAEQRVVDLSYAAWELVSDRPLSAGLVEVRVILHDPALAAAWRRG